MEKKNPEEIIINADAVILCLADNKSMMAVSSWIEPSDDCTVLIDASRAFYVDYADQTYGFPGKEFNRLDCGMIVIALLSSSMP